MFKTWDDRKFNRFFKLALLVLLCLAIGVYLFNGLNRRYYLKPPFRPFDAAAFERLQQELTEEGD